jgi:hypothetical protein
LESSSPLALSLLVGIHGPPICYVTFTCSIDLCLLFLEALEHLYFVWLLFQSLGRYEDIAFEDTVRRLYSLLSFVVRISLLF